MRGYYGIGILHAKTEMNIGTLWHSARLMGASFIFTIDKPFKRQPTDSMGSWRDIPLYHYNTLDAFYKAIPYDCQLIGVEIDDAAIPIEQFRHPARCIYLLGVEDHGLTYAARDMCHRLVKLPGERSMDVAIAGSIVMYDRLAKIGSSREQLHALSL